MGGLRSKYTLSMANTQLYSLVSSSSLINSVSTWGEGATTDEGERAKSASNSEGDGGIEWSRYKPVQVIWRTVI